MSNNTNSINMGSIQELIENLKSPNRFKGNTIIHPDNNAITGAQDAKNLKIDRVTKDLYLDLIVTIVKYIEENRMKFSIGHFDVGTLKIDGDDLMALTNNSFGLVHAYILNSPEANEFINEHSKHEQSQMLMWVSNLLKANGVWKKGVRDMMSEWEKQTDASADSLNEILELIETKQEQLK